MSSSNLDNESTGLVQLQRSTYMYLVENLLPFNGFCGLDGKSFSTQWTSGEGSQS